METGTDAIQSTPYKGWGQRPGGANRRQCARPVANRELAGSEPCATQCLLRLSWTPGHGRTVLAQSAEPPDADPHVRWCGRGGEVTLPPMPIRVARTAPCVIATEHVGAGALTRPAEHSSARTGKLAPARPEEGVRA